jgi:hypothetical protein
MILYGFCFAKNVILMFAGEEISQEVFVRIWKPRFNEY